MEQELTHNDIAVTTKDNSTFKIVIKDQTVHLDRGQTTALLDALQSPNYVGVPTVSHRLKEVQNNLEAILDSPQWTSERLKEFLRSPEHDIDDLAPIILITNAHPELMKRLRDAVDLYGKSGVCLLS